ncbi:MAG: tRNA (adenosine(37)-N6)-threonylcarbamoyltransferase complex dimerization subunit type 1 TsaB [Thermoflexaceae bacterium]|nr:tRNA (adenosine(37)-N6)-threonylcarbamoyltransferase complex dimerization subunit type 1 TsaB [Thermoflexaceae bacterium]
MSIVLAIDTASAELALALAIDGECVGSFATPAGHDHSRLLIPGIDRMLGSRRAELSGIVVVHGPGSYAGLRVGIATAEGLALASGVPVAGVGTLEAAAAAAGLIDGTVIHPAGRGEFAALSFANGAATGPARLIARDEVQGPGFAGEGAGELGGHEVPTERRCRAALALGLAVLRSAPSSAVEAFYLREPHITRPRRTPLLAG